MNTYSDNIHNLIDIAKLAVAMREHGYFFALRRGIDVNFCADLNGSGTQGIFIRKKSFNAYEPSFIEVIFEPTHKSDDSFLYEEDLTTDQRKDYEPSINRGKHRFVARRAKLNLDWNSNEIHQWRLDIERLTKPHNTLNDWLKNDSEIMIIHRCGGYRFREPVILSQRDIKQYVASGLTLEDLKNRLKCSICGERNAKIKVF